MLTERDYRALHLLARYRYATLEQLADYWNTTVDTTRRRFNKLEDAKFVVSRRSGHRQSRFYIISPSGLGLLHTDLTVPKYNATTLGHTLIATDLGVAWERQGVTVVTERQMRAIDQRHLDPTGAPVDPSAELRWLIRLNTPTGRTQTKIPDLALEQGGWGKDIAVEVELTKKTGEYPRLMQAYAAGRYAEVWFYIDNQAWAPELMAAAAQVGAAQRVKVFPIRPKHPIPGYFPFHG